MNIKQRIQAKETKAGKLLIWLSIIGEVLVESIVQFSQYTALLPDGENINSIIPAPALYAVRMLALIGIVAGKLTAQEHNLIGEKPEKGKSSVG